MTPISDDGRSRFRPMDYGGLVGPLWFAGWLFTLGLVGLSPWKALLALMFWPYMLGVALKWHNLRPRFASMQPESPRPDVRTKPPAAFRPAIWRSSS